ncbi:MAG: HEAT repeat domain-containing protein, partial [Phycisphaerae bacterium]
MSAADSKVRAEAAAELVTGGERSLPAVRALMASDDEQVRLAGFEIAYRIGPPAVGMLAEFLRDDRVAQRRLAIDFLIDLAPDTESIQPALHRALRDPDESVARDAARALGALGPKAAPSVPALVDALGSDEELVRLYAAEALASVGPRAASAVDALIALLRDPAPGVRWAAC